MSKSKISLKTATANGNNIGTGEGIFSNINPANTLNFKSIVHTGGTQNVIVLSDSEHIYISGSTSGVNDATNIGSGIGLFSANVSGTLQFKSISSLTPSFIKVTSNANNLFLSGNTGLTEQIIEVENLLLTEYYNIGQINNGFQPILEPQTALTTGLTGLTQAGTFSADYTIQAMTNVSPYGFVSSNEAESVLQVIINLQTRVNELEQRLISLGLLQTN